MDTVTEARMAIAMARQGGIGILHRNMSAEDQAVEVDLVKRSEAGMLTNPVTCGPDDTIADVERLCARYRISGAPVVSADGILLGVVTNRDMRFVEDPSILVRDVMTAMPLVTAPVGTLVTTPSRCWRSTGWRNCPWSTTPPTGRADDGQGLHQVREVPAGHQGTTPDDSGSAPRWGGRGLLKRARLLIDAGVDVVVVDTAHGHSRAVLDTVRRIKNDTDVDVIGGNIATGEAAAALIEAGADGAKVGVGPGPSAPTRVVAGVGVPQVSAIHEAARVAGPAGVPVIGDGGLQYSGDIAKAVVAGADTVMLGSAAGRVRRGARGDVLPTAAVQAVPRHGVVGSHAVARRSPPYPRTGTSRTMLSDDKLVPEGIEGQVPYRGPLAAVAHQPWAACGRRWGTSGAADVAELKLGTVRAHHRSRPARESPARRAGHQRSPQLLSLVEVEHDRIRPGRCPAQSARYSFDEVSVVPSPADPRRRRRRSGLADRRLPVRRPRSWRRPWIRSSPHSAALLSDLGLLSVLSLEGCGPATRTPNRSWPRSPPLRPTRQSVLMQQIYPVPSTGTS